MTDLHRAEREATAQAAAATDGPVLAALGQASEIADQPPLLALAAVILGGGLIGGDRRLAAAGGRMLAAELLATGVKDAIKARVDRTRPEVEHEGGTYRAEPGDSRAHALSSFPSGHTAGAVAVALAAGRVYPGLRWPLLALAGGIAAVQVPRGKHYPSDLIVGAAIGVAAAAAVNWLGDRAGGLLAAATAPDGD